MEVRALEMGFYGGRRIRPGQTFEVPDGHTARWFAPVGEPKQGDVKAGKGKGGKAQKAEPVALSELGNQPNQGFNDVVGKADDLA